jgi:transcriptional regulator with XRE-family HTH domain
MPPPIAGRDPQIGSIFRNMRSALRLSREAIARHLATTPATIDDFENGALSALPHWRETVRIVRSYCEMLRLDPEPLLWRLQSQLRNGLDVDETTGPPRAAQPPALLRQDRRREQPERRRSKRGARRLFALGAPVLALAAALYLANAAPAPLYVAAKRLPDPLAGYARAGLDQFVHFTAPQRDGLRWIDVGNPQLRKTDKLQTSTR